MLSLLMMLNTCCVNMQTAMKLSKLKAEPNVGVNVKLHVQKCFVYHPQTQSNQNSCIHDLNSISSRGKSCFKWSQIAGANKTKSMYKFMVKFQKLAICPTLTCYCPHWIVPTRPLKEDPSKYSISNLLHNMLTKFGQRSPKDPAN